MGTENGIVYIEDDLANRSLMSSIFARYFPDVPFTVARNGADGLATLEGASPQLILLDGYLGDMTAAEFVATLRERWTGSWPTVVVVSGSLPPDSATAIEGVSAHVMKPFKIAELVEIIQDHLEEPGA